jgi:hypothetical protein
MARTYTKSFVQSTKTFVPLRRGGRGHAPAYTPSVSLPLHAPAVSEDELQARFDALQRRLVPLWRSIRSLNEDEQTIVVVPSMTVDRNFPGATLKAYEERFLFLLFLCASRAPGSGT